MAESMTTSGVVHRRGPAAADWSVGIFGPSAVQLPEQCLRSCLRGNPEMAAMLGCPLLKGLVRRTRPGALISEAEPLHVPELCEKGFVPWLRSAVNGGPDVLVLRPGACPNVNVAPALELVSQLVGDAWRYEQENNGLADEVLRNYEQINLIFDVSAQIAILNDASEVRRMLLMKLRYLFDADSVFYFSPDLRMVQEVSHEGGIRRGWVKESDPREGPSFNAEPGGQGEQAEIMLPRELPQVIERLRQARRVLVSSDDVAYDDAGHGTSMWGPLSETDSGFATVGIVRRNKPFIAGDMLVLDSALTFGSHILSNLRLVEQLKRTSFEAVRALVNAIDQKDTYTSGHSERVGFLARITGEYMGLAPQLQQELEWAGLLHDVGKIGIPERVLNKPGSLTAEEFGIIKGHPRRSFEVLRPVASLEPVLRAVLHHHECPDGSGYPEGLRGDEIPLAARIIHVVDVFDALTSTRSYRRAYNVERAMNILKQDAGTKLDARIVDQFIGAWQLLPKTHPQQYADWFASISDIGGEAPAPNPVKQREQQPAQLAAPVSAEQYEEQTG